MLQLFAVEIVQKVATGLGEVFTETVIFYNSFFCSFWDGLATLPGEGAASPTQDFIVPLICCVTLCSGAEM